MKKLANRLARHWMYHKSKYLVITYATKIIKETATKMVEMEREHHWSVKNMVSFKSDTMHNFLILFGLKYLFDWLLSINIFILGVEGKLGVFEKCDPWFKHSPRSNCQHGDVCEFVTFQLNGKTTKEYRCIPQLKG